MDISTEKNKIMTNIANNSSADISMNGQKLEEMSSFKYLGATLYKDGTCSAEIRIGIASAMTAMARLNRIRRYNTISFASKFKLYKSIVCCHLYLPVWVPAGSPSRGGDVVVHIFDINQQSLPSPLYSVLVSISVSWPFQLYFIP